MSKPEEVDKMRRLLKPLRELVELNEWISHTRKMIAKVEGLKEDRDTLEIIIPEVILLKNVRDGLRGGTRKMKEV